MLGEAGILHEFRPTVAPSEVKRAMLRLPKDVADRMLPSYWQAHADVGAERLDERLPAEVATSGAVPDVDYDVALDDLLSQIDRMITYPSQRRAGATSWDRLRRSFGYLVLSAVNGMDYYPDFDRVPFVSAAVNDLYRSLPRELYERVSEALDTDRIGGGQEEVVNEWTLRTSLPIPPATALVLGRSRSLDEIPTRLLEVRDEFAGYRRHFRAFRAQLQAADSINERRRLRKTYTALLAEASGPHSELISATEALNFAQKVVAVGAAPAIPTSYSAALLSQPVDWLRRWWRRRPLAILFRLDGKLPRLSEYETMVERIWGRRIQEATISAYVDHALQVEQIMTTPHQA